MKALTLSLLLLPLVARGQDVALPFFAADSALDIDPCPTNVFAFNANTSGSGIASATNGLYMCQKISNTSATPVRIKRFSAGLGQHSSGPANVATFTGYATTTPDMATATIYGSASISTNILRSGYIADMNWAPGTEPIIPANTDFYIGGLINPGAEAIVTTAYWNSAGSGYRDTAYYCYYGGSILNGDTRQDLLAFEVMACFDWTLPEEPYITADWNSETAPQGRMMQWRSDKQWLDVIAPVGTTTNDYLFNTRDGVIFSSSVMGNDGYSRIAAPSYITAGNNASVWFTLKREDWQTTQYTFGNAGGGQLYSYQGWDNFWNMATPKEIAIQTNHYHSRWTDILLTVTNGATYSIYYDGVLKTNQPVSAALVLYDVAQKAVSLPNLSRFGRIVVWTNTVLVQTNATKLHNYMLTNNIDIAPVSNALPAFTGLKHAWRTAGYIGRMGRLWTDYVSGNGYQAYLDHINADPTYLGFEYIATGRGIRMWSSQTGMLMRNGGFTGGLTPPATYTVFMTFTPSTYPANGLLIYTPSGYSLSFDGTTGIMKATGGFPVSGVLALNQTHTYMGVYNGTSTYSYIDGAYYTNQSGGMPETWSYLGGIGPINFNNNFDGHFAELLVYTNTALTNADALAYHTYATNQYVAEWQGVTNSPMNTTPGTENPFGYRLQACSSNLWTTPVLQQQTNENNYGNCPPIPSWTHQKITNGSPTEVRIKTVRAKLDATPGGANTRAICFVAKTNYNGYIGGVTGRPFPDQTYGISSTNLVLNAAAQWYTFDFDQANTPIVPAGQDFYLIFMGLDNYISYKYYSVGTPTTGGTGYSDYYHDFGFTSTGDGSVGDLMFEIYTCQ